MLALAKSTAQILVPVMREQRIPAWPRPNDERAPKVDYQPLEFALLTEHATDAHTTAYSVPLQPYRLNKSAPETLKGGVRMVLAVFDIDGPNHQATDEWWGDQGENLARLNEVVPDLYVYRTRGGYRIVARLAEAFVIKTADDAKAWTDKYLQWCAWLWRCFQIKADPVGDWQRLYRLPVVKRDGNIARYATLGDAANVGVWTCTPSAEDIETAKALRRKPVADKPKGTAKVRAQTSNYTGSGILVRALQNRGDLGSEIQPGMWAIRCPRANEHHSGADFDTSAVVFAPNSVGDELGWIDCKHTNCGHFDKSLKDWLRCFDQSELDRAREQLGISVQRPQLKADNDHAEYSDADAPDEPPHVPENKTPERIPDVIATVLDEWGTSGPLVHEPTGIARLDELTGGGPVYGTRWVITGQPDAGKTALMLQIGHVYALRNISVGLMAVDEEAGDIVTRLAQRIGYARQHCELRDPLVLADMRVGLGGLPMYFYAATWTIENAAADLASRASATGSRAMLGVDSLQTVHCSAESIAQREMSEVSAVTARMHAIRNVATRYKLIAIATSEMGRSAYRSNDPTQQSTTLASAKWSGAVEYSARVLIGLRSVAGETDLIELELAKNKHGPRDEKLHLRIDRRSQTLTGTAYEPPPEESRRGRDDAAKDQVVQDAAAVAAVLLRRPGIGVRDLRGAVKAETGMGIERLEAAKALLGDALIRGEGPNNSVPLTLDLASLPESVRHAMK